MRPTTQTTYTRRDHGDGATETLQIVQLLGGDTRSLGQTTHETRYAVQVTRGTPAENGDLVGLYDLDGDELRLSSGIDWEIPESVPQEIAELVSEGWETATTVVEPWIHSAPPACVGGVGTRTPCAEPATEERVVESVVVHLCAAHAAELDSETEEL